MRLSRKKSKRVKYFLWNGPYMGHHALLPEETMVFTAHGMTGRYVEGKWENVR